MRGQAPRGAGAPAPVSGALAAARSCSRTAACTSSAVSPWWMVSEPPRVSSCRRPRAVVLAKAEEHHRDVVLAAALVRGLDQRGGGRPPGSGRRAGCSRCRRRRSCPVRPSEHSRYTSPSRAVCVWASTSTSDSGPSARVMIERCGWFSAASAVSCPLRWSSATSEWSWVSCSSVAVAQPVGAAVAHVADAQALAPRPSPPSAWCPCPGARRRSATSRRSGGWPHA